MCVWRYNRRTILLLKCWQLTSKVKDVVSMLGHVNSGCIFLQMSIDSRNQQKIVRDIIKK